MKGRKTREEEGNKGRLPRVSSGDDKKRKEQGREYFDFKRNYFETTFSFIQRVLVLYFRFNVMFFFFLRCLIYSVDRLLFLSTMTRQRVIIRTWPMFNVSTACGFLFRATFLRETTLAVRQYRKQGSLLSET